MLSKNRNHLKWFDALLRALPSGCIFDGEIVVLDANGRPKFNDLLFRRGDPAYVVFDVLYAGGQDLSAEPLRRRKSLLKKMARKKIPTVDYVVGESGALFGAVCKLDLEGIVAKRLSDPYAAQTKWFKILNPTYSQKVGRHKLFEH